MHAAPTPQRRSGNYPLDTRRSAHQSKAELVAQCIAHDGHNLPCNSTHYKLTSVRLYLTTSSRGASEGRPSTLALLHVRLPPGFEPHAPSQRVHNVRTALCQRGTTLLVTPHSSGRDIIWTLASDAYPFQARFMETSTFDAVDAGVCCLATGRPSRAPRPQCTIKMPDGTVVRSDPPAVVTQHFEGPQKFVLLSRTSCCLYEKPRPVDMLRGLLQEGNTPECARQAFFALHGEVQASAICLSLACNSVDVQLAERATGALAHYAGVAKVTQCEGPSTSQHSAIQASVSGRHDGCYLYFSRLVRPLWSMCYLSTRRHTQFDSDVYVTSISGQDVQFYLESISQFQRFLQKWLDSSMFADVEPESRIVSADPLHRQGQRTLMRVRDEPETREWASLRQLLQLVGYTAELLSLWRVLSDHQLRVALAAFPPGIQIVLYNNVTFHQMLLADRQVPGALAAALVYTYLQDDAAAEAVSNRLRSVCPSIYRTEDLFFTRVHQKIVEAQAERSLTKRRMLLDQAVKLCKKIGPKLPLGNACALLKSCHHYDGVLELGLALAQQADPRGVALHFYQQGWPHEDELGRRAYADRLQFYQVTCQS
ncbi:hypothetical protein HPB50_011973 [Hyalomma asiaticum]|uniref:Uncharacterized protein n=1 Tax=Hyalomma asiaticum TaxID=266040 RepID=A0ACB7T9T8_HYAAI|nr:hypothetical protein HPB50_011973 [Hyalomma asiaticum]